MILTIFRAHKCHALVIKSKVRIIILVFKSMPVFVALYQYHVSSGDVHVGLCGLFTPGRCAAVRAGTVLRSIAELRRHTADSRCVGPPSTACLWTGERWLGCHVLATQLLRDAGKPYHYWLSINISNYIFRSIIITVQLPISLIAKAKVKWI